MLVVAAFVSVGTQLGTVVAALSRYVEHLVWIIAVDDAVAADAPELLAIVHLEFVRVHTVTCRATSHRDVSAFSVPVPKLFETTLYDSVNERDCNSVAGKPPSVAVQIKGKETSDRPRGTELKTTGKVKNIIIVSIGVSVMQANNDQKPYLA